MTQLIAVGQKPFDWFSEIPGAAGYLFEVVFAGVSLAIVWGAMAERAKLYVYFVFGIVFTLIYSITSHWIWSPHGWLFAKGMQDFAGSTVVHYQGALAALAGALLLGPRIGKFGTDGRANPIPGHNIPYAVLGTIILWFGWFGFNPGSTLSVDFGGVGYFAYVAMTTNIAAAAGALGGIVTAWVVLKKPDISMMLNGVIAALVAITAASGFVAPWAAIVIGLVSGVIAVVGVIWVEGIGDRRPDRRGRRARHVRHLGHARAAASSRCRCSRRTSPRARAASSTRASFHQLGVQALGVAVVGVWTFSRVVRRPLGDEEAVGHPRRRGGRDARARRLRARHVGLPRVLHPGPGRLRDRVAQPPRSARARSAAAGTRRCTRRRRRSRASSGAGAGGSGCGRSRPAAGDRGKQDQGRALGDRGLEPVEETDVGAVDEDVQELRQLVAVEDAAAQRRVRRDQALERLAHRRPGHSICRLPPASGLRIGGMRIVATTEP